MKFVSKVSERAVKISWSFRSSQFTTKTVSARSLLLCPNDKVASVLNIRPHEVKRRIYLSDSRAMNFHSSCNASRPDDAFTRVVGNEYGLKSLVSFSQLHIYFCMPISFRNWWNNCIQNSETLYFRSELFQNLSPYLSSKLRHVLL